MKLYWTEERKPNDFCRYNHTMADTHFGKFLLTWKGWKDEPYYGMGFDETPWGEAWYGNWNTAAEAIAAAEEKYAMLLKTELDRFNKIEDNAQH